MIQVSTNTLFGFVLGARGLEQREHCGIEVIAPPLELLCVFLNRHLRDQH